MHSKLKLVFFFYRVETRVWETTSHYRGYKPEGIYSFTWILNRDDWVSTMANRMGRKSSSPIRFRTCPFVDNFESHHLKSITPYTVDTCPVRLKVRVKGLSKKVRN